MSDLANPIYSTQVVFDTEDGTLDFESLYAAHRPKLIHSLIRLGVDAVEAEDITQDVFLRTIDPARHHAPVRNFFGWLTTSAKNLAITLHHRGQREVLAAPVYWKQWEDTLPDPAQDVLTSLEEWQRKDEMLRALSKLTYREQQCILMRGQGKTFQETADSLGITLRKAMYASETALRKLQRELQGPAL